jgi:peptidoglycan/LPS O-acetylase OafA/YrhL
MTSGRGVEPARAGRLMELDGIRGWAALSVVVFHMTWETFGAVLPQLRNPLTGFFLDGGIAVSAFFVLSGEALSAGFFAGGGELSVYRQAIKRYTRLTIPVIAACTLTVLLYRADLTYHVAAADLVHRADWLGSFMHTAPGLRESVTYMLFDVYTNVPNQHAVIPFLWTMRFELLGSILVFGVLLGLSRLRGMGLLFAWLFIGLLFAATIYGRQDHLACFLAGLGFARLRSLGFFGHIQSDGRVKIMSYIAILVIGTLDGFSHWLLIGRGWVPLASVLLVFAVFCNRRLCAAFTSRISQSLGRISFPLYLIQFPVLISITSYAICYAGSRGMLLPWTIVAISVTSVLVCLAAARAFAPIERLTRSIGNAIALRILDSNSTRVPIGRVRHTSSGNSPGANLGNSVSTERSDRIRAASTGS